MIFISKLGFPRERFVVGAEFEDKKRRSGIFWFSGIRWGMGMDFTEDPFQAAQMNEKSAYDVVNYIITARKCKIWFNFNETENRIVDGTNDIRLVRLRDSGEISLI